MSLVDVIMPQLGESLTEGIVSEWLKAPGDAIARDEPLLTVETEKVNTAIEAEISGILEETLVEPGTVVAVGTVIARIRQAASTSASSAMSAPAAPSGTPTASDTRTVSDIAPAAPAPAASDEPASRGHLGANSQATLFPAHTEARQRAAATPAHDLRIGSRAQELATRYHVTAQELTQLGRSLDKARPSPQDILRYVADRSLRNPPPLAPTGTVPMQAAPAAPAPMAYPPTPPARYRYRPNDRDLVRHLSAKRMVIADHMSWSQTISAHATALMEVDMSAAAQFLATQRDAHQAATGVRLTYTTLIAYAAVQALAAYPELNASVVDDSIVIKPYVNLGIAVATHDKRELVVPVVHDADSLPFAELARRLTDLTHRARAQQLSQADVTGGTFSFSNPGTVGGLAGTPIINQPQVAVLAANAIVRRPVVLEGSDTIVIRPIMVLSLSMDHRIIDGALGFAYLADVRQRLEQWAP
ncbi:dihydrolipoamide acetyltransferase family protein [Castellaniella caeni]|uniref:dihydrolipoamide acetyltransferase family protein n=1 Tax=Castellaniella caeni TaxID=266123 RepID=UPI000832F32F|nr:dihydrolipoamide acetyltransferase family protein [Castellaniella caeni]